MVSESNDFLTHVLTEGGEEASGASEPSGFRDASRRFRTLRTFRTLISTSCPRARAREHGIAEKRPKRPERLKKEVMDAIPAICRHPPSDQ
jgi:hypothetical protein